MGPALLLLLPLLASLLDAAPADCDTGSVLQPEHLEAPEGGSVRIFCAFLHIWELAKIPEVKIGWRWKHFHGDFIYNQTRNWTHEEFKGRVRVVWSQDYIQGALLIWNLRRGDATTYFCQVTLNTKSCGKQEFQSILGTKLSVTQVQSLPAPLTAGLRSPRQPPRAAPLLSALSRAGRGLAPLLLLLPLLASLLDAAPADCDTGSVLQPEHLEAPEGGSVRIYYIFILRPLPQENPEVKIGWRWKHFHGDFIYNQTRNWTHEEFKGRVRMDWSQDYTRGALHIWNLRREDTTTYFCQVTLNTKSCGKQEFQSIQGTKLSIIPAQPEAGLDVTNSTQNPGPLMLDTVVAVTVTVALLKITILGLISCLVWKRSQGS